MSAQNVRPPDGCVLVACSGGPDSLALLAALHALQTRLSLTLTVATVDHHFRDASAAEADAVVAWARARNLIAQKLDVYPAHKTQRDARAARYRALGDCARQHGASTIAVAHTASDQAETMLDKMLRGTGIVGLGGMAPTRAVAADEFGSAPFTLIRPLIGVTRADVEAFVAAESLVVARDPSNEDSHYRRARLRKNILPALRAERADVDLALAQLATRLRGSSEIIAYATRAAAAAVADVTRPRALDVTRLHALPAALQVEVLRARSPFLLDARHVHALVALCAHTRGTQTLDLPGGQAIRAYDQLRFVTNAPATAPLPSSRAIDGPGVYPFADGEVHIAPAFFANLSAPLALRNLRAGDRYRCPQLDRDVRIQNLLVNEKIPRHRRRLLPALANLADQNAPLVWVGGVRRLAHPEISWRVL